MALCLVKYRDNFTFTLPYGKRLLLAFEDDGTGAGSCAVDGFYRKGVEHSGSTSRKLVNECMTGLANFAGCFGAKRI